MANELLTLDLRTRRYGFAAFDRSRRLLGWGFRKNPHTTEMIQEHLTTLQSRFGFSRIVVRRRADARSQRRQHDLVDGVVRFGSLGRLPVTLIDADKIRSFFNGKSKYEIAKLVAERFPEIAWKLPPKRKVWQSESERQSIFDAISTGVYFFQSGG